MNFAHPALFFELTLTLRNERAKRGKTLGRTPNKKKKTPGRLRQLPNHVLACLNTRNLQLVRKSFCPAPASRFKQAGRGRHEKKNLTGADGEIRYASQTLLFEPMGVGRNHIDRPRWGGGGGIP